MRVQTDIRRLARGQVLELANILLKLSLADDQGVPKSLAVGVLELLLELLVLGIQLDVNALLTETLANSQVVVESASFEVGDEDLRWGVLAPKTPQFVECGQQAIEPE